MDQWRDAREIFIGNSVTVGPQLSDDAVDVDGVPNEHGIGKQAQATRLVHDLLVVASAEGAVIGEEQPLRERVTEFTPVELELDRPPERFLVNIAQDMDGFGQAPERGQGSGDAIGRAGVDDPLQDDMRRRQPVLQRGGDAHELIPLLDDDGGVDGVAQQRVERAVIGAAVDPVQHLIGKIPEPRHEIDAEQEAEAPQGFGEPAGVGRVLADRQNGIVLQDAVEDVVGLARRAGDRLRAVDAVLVGGVGIERERPLVMTK
jgi:hypothetical protein